MAFAGVSFLWDSHNVRSSPPCNGAANSACGFHLVVIQNYSKIKKAITAGFSIDSSSFKLGGHRWHIEYFPNGNTNTNSDYVSFSLVHEYDYEDEEDAQEYDAVDQSVKATFKFSFSSSEARGD
uniref:MATH domain-containing protein n=1 Tax=Leersia perrieri TaxID=77586 RepID=A0A0D9XJW8_9ORYZ